MAGYAATGRIERAAPRFLPACPRGDDDVPLASMAELEEGPAPAVDEVSGRGFAADLLDLLSDIRQVWRQGMDVLADPQGWR